MQFSKIIKLSPKYSSQTSLLLSYAIFKYKIAVWLFSSIYLIACSKDCGTSLFLSINVEMPFIAVNG